MKRLFQFWIWFVTAVATQGATLNYNLGDYTLNPTNVLFSNLVSTAQITWSMGQSGRITGTITSTGFDENWTNIANVLTPVSANVRGLSWGTNNNLIAGSLHLVTPASSQNTIYGLDSATNITGGSGFNTFVGSRVAVSMTTGEENTAVGSPALESVTTGEQNTAIGSDALISLIDGNDNAALGYGALTQARNSRNTGVGRGAGDALTTGGGNSFLGWFADTSVNSVTNSTALGQNSVLTKSNQMVFGSGVTNYQINGVDYVFPAANAVGALLNDSAGMLTWATSVPSWNVGGNLNVSILQVTNEATFFGPVTNHTTLRATNIFDGGWLEVVGEQTNDAGLTLSARTASSILRTDANKAVAEVTVGSGLSFDGTTLSASATLDENWTNTLDAYRAVATNTFLFGKKDGALLLGRNAETVYGLPGGGESLISLRDSTAGDPAFNYFTFWTRTGVSRDKLFAGSMYPDSVLVEVTARHNTDGAFIYFTVNTNGTCTFDLWSNTVSRTKFTASGDNYFNGAGARVGILTNAPKAALHIRTDGVLDNSWLEVGAQQTNRSDIYAAGGAFVDNARITNGLNVAGTIGASIIRVTNETTHLGPVTNHQALRATNIFNGGWTENVGPQTNRDKVDIAGKLTSSILQNTNEVTFFGLQTNHTTFRGTNIFDGGWLEVVGPQTNRDKIDIAGKVTASILQVTNEVTMFGLQTNHTTLIATNIFNGGWNRIQSPSTNESTHWGTNEFNGGWLQVAGNQTNAGSLRVTNGILVPSAGGLTLGTGGTVTNMLFGSAALNFPSTGASAKADLSITVTGTVEGDEAFVGVPATAAQVTGNFTWYTSNDTVWVRFFSGAAAQNPANATFKAIVFKR